MKTSIKLFAFIILFVAAGCDKEQSLENKLSGSWELRHIKGGFRPVGDPSDYPAGNGRIIIFEGDSFQTFYNGNLSNSGTYSIVKEKANPNGDELSYKIVYQGNLRQPDAFFKVSSKKLVLYVGSIAADGAEVTYEKLKEGSGTGL